ncbi:FHA domain-containing protein [Campylobacter sp. MIT 21-1685]|uniref:FHA domain-containing protein n=1 Tax=unclassified Campylobacter TaxID=2593542 RepID=UPI00224B77AE|nr:MULTISPECIES: FHA domain-containing protein [unclassified Campylobacter]MCX2683848.1 FHA domain-containing protein [Campylobacter sp. MIT 21-1684]MCX2752132.1 FHA domain-containing protein [Campylobacter sp. MIT 21-1682]MCX2808326.1 FHA domain-containing protein [Campylobacter sp. MIT 21-1685]
MVDNEEKIGVIIESLEEILTRDKAYVFDKEGGFIGSDSQCSFCVQDKENKIQNKHLRIGFEEGFFTIAPVGDAAVFYNESFSKMQGGFETVINKGDIFRISNVQFRFVDYKEINEEFLRSKEKLDNIEKCDEIDEGLLKPRGKVQFDFKEKENIKELIESKTDYAFIEEKIDNSFLNQSDEKNPLAFEYQNVLKTLDKVLKELQMNQKSAKLNEQYGELDIKDLEKIIANIPLIKSTKLINLLALSLISKELYSPIFEEMEEDMFIKYLQVAIQGNIKEDKALFENLTIKALEKYKKRYS